MVFQVRALSRFATSSRRPRERTHAYVYTTEDSAADVLAEGYFNAALERFRLRVGDVIDVAAGVLGTPAAVRIAVAAIVAGVVTVSDIGGSGAASPLTIPTASLKAVYAAVRTNGYTGPAVQIRRAADNAVQDIGFTSSGTIDSAAAATFAPLGYTVSRWYDQSGNGKHLVQATASAQPALVPANAWGSVLPITFGQEAAQFLGCGTLDTLDRAAQTTYTVISPRTTYRVAGLIDLTSADLATSYYATANAARGAMATNGGGTARNLRALPQVVAWSAGTPLVSRVAGAQASGGVAPASQAIGGVRIGQNVSTLSQMGDYFCVAIYGASHTAATMQSVEASLVSAFAIPATANFGKRVAYGGSSLITGQGVGQGRTPAWLAGFGRPGARAGWDVQVYAEAGRSLASEYGLRADFTGSYVAAYARNVFVIDAPSNDLSTATYASQAAAEQAATDLYNNTTVPFVQALIAPGYKVVVPTVIPRGAFDTTTNFKEFARLKYNQIVRDGAAANGYTVSDRAGDARLQNANDTTYFQADKTHLTAAGTQVLAEIDAAAIELAAA